MANEFLKNYYVLLNMPMDSSLESLQAKTDELIKAEETHQANQAKQAGGFFSSRSLIEKTQQKLALLTEAKAAFSSQESKDKADQMLRLRIEEIYKNITSEHPNYYQLLNIPNNELDSKVLAEFKARVAALTLTKLNLSSGVGKEKYVKMLDEIVSVLDTKIWNRLITDLEQKKYTNMAPR